MEIRNLAQAFHRIGELEAKLKAAEAEVAKLDEACRNHEASATRYEDALAAVVWSHDWGKVEALLRGRAGGE